MKTICGLVLVAGMATPALADIEGLNLQLVSSQSLTDLSGFGQRATPGASYSNIDTFGGQVSINGGATAGITRLQADDVQCARPDLTGQAFRRVTFSVGNLNTVSVSARPRVRFWLGDGAGGAPHTLIAGFTFNPITFNAGSANLYFFDPGAGVILQPPPGMTLWAGMTFDNVGATATNDQLNNLGQLLMNPPAVGSSPDNMFATTAAGSHFNADPVGGNFNFGGNPAANVAWEFVVPAPGTLALVGFGGLFAARRRR